MGNTDSLPVVSQVKSLVQVIGGDTKGAERTQENFVKGCPIISQAVAVAALIAGDTELAKETQEYFLHNIDNMTDSIPVVGHVKGTVHYILGDKDRGDNAMKAASRTVGVAAGGIGGFLIGGPAGAFAGGVSGGAGMDAVISLVDSAVHDEERLYGHFYSMNQALDGEMTPGEAFDWAATPVFDGLSGRSYGKMYRNYRLNKAQRASLNNKIKQSAIKDINKEQMAKEMRRAARKLKKSVDKVKQGDVNKGTMTRIIDVEGNRYDGYSYRLREAMNIDAFKGELSSTQQILAKKYRGGAPRIRGTTGGQPACAEHHALNQLHRANGNHAVPKMMITIQYDGKNINAIARCNNCMKIGRSIPMGDVITDRINGLPVPAEMIVRNAVLDAIAAELIDICDCDNPHEEDE